MNDSDWFYEIQAKVHGPISWRQLKVLAGTNRLKRTDFVWCVSDNSRRQAKTVDGLFEDSTHDATPSSGHSRLPLKRADDVPMECERCGFQFTVSKEFIGRQGRCPIPSCGQTFVVPEPFRLPGEDLRDSVGFDELELAEFPTSKRPRPRKSAQLPKAKPDQQSLRRFIFQSLTRVDRPTPLLALAGGVVLVLVALAIWSLSGTIPQSRNVPSIAGTTASSTDRFQANALPVLQKYCADCHAGNEGRGDFSLTPYPDEASILAHRPQWERLTNLITSGIMPPADAPQIPVSDKDTLLKYLDATIFHVDCSGDSDPGRVTVRRLNRFEYNNTIRDLLGINFQPADDFPSDDVGHGFDNIGEILSLSPLLMEKYLIAAENIAATAAASAVRRTADLPEPLQRLIVHHPRDGKRPIDCLRENLRPLLPRAFRRPVPDDELNRVIVPAYVAIERSESFEFAMRTALTAVLVSPHFLFRAESNDSPVDSLNIRLLTGHELASRLSYFLWSSMPDEELLQHAAVGDLQSDAVLAAQVHRMLKDWKSSALTDSFAVQWLHLKSLDDARPNSQQFPEFNQAVKEDLKQETKSFFEHVVRQDRSILEFLDGQYTFLNGRLARYYCITGVAGDQFQKVSLAGMPRAGLLTQGSVLTLTSLSTRTSPVKRGKWILEVILDQPPPPPPPTVPSLDQATSDSNMTLRQQLESHRANPACISCHQVMDSLGFGMENFDPIGRWRTSDGQQPLDTTGQLPSRRTFHGPTELVSVLKERDTDFARALTSKLLTYALGRPLTRSDRCTVNSIVQTLKANDFHFSVLITEIVKSRPFRMRSVKGSES